MLTIPALIENASEANHPEIPDSYRAMRPLMHSGRISADAPSPKPGPTAILAATLVVRIRTTHDTLTATLDGLRFHTEYAPQRMPISDTLQAAWSQADAVVSASAPTVTEALSRLSTRLAAMHHALYLLLAEMELHFARAQGRLPDDLYRFALAGYALLAEAARAKAAR